MLLIASGMGGALFACLILRFVWASVADRSKDQIWRNSNAINEMLYVLGHAAMGAGVGLLFWLSWGFTALAGLNWWQHGLEFGLINAAVFGILPLFILRSLMRCSAAVYWLLISEVLLTSVAAALAASWSWQKAF